MRHLAPLSLAAYPAAFTMALQFAIRCHGDGVGKVELPRSRSLSSPFTELATTPVVFKNAIVSVPVDM
jgi:hypothetical protein